MIPGTGLALLLVAVATVSVSDADQQTPSTILLFTVAAKSNNGAADVFLNSDIRHGQLPDGKPLPDLHRYELIDSLETAYETTDMKYIVAELRAGTRMVAQVVFDISVRRSEINKESWFARDRVVSSFPYDLGDSFNYFSIRGHEGWGWKRSFFISFNYGGCGSDKSFWVVSERSDVCYWASRDWSGGGPVFIYSTSREGPSMANGGAHYDADRFLIYLM